MCKLFAAIMAAATLACVSSATTVTPAQADMRSVSLARPNVSLECSFNGSAQGDTHRVWFNHTGRPITIWGATLWLGADDGNRYDVGSSLVRLSDGAILFMNNWDRYGQSATLSDRDYAFMPSGYVLQPGDGLFLHTWCYAYDRAGSMAGAFATIRYTF